MHVTKCSYFQLHRKLVMMVALEEYNPEDLGSLLVIIFSNWVISDSYWCKVVRNMPS